jgi:hypothetical protein
MVCVRACVYVMWGAWGATSCSHNRAKMPAFFLTLRIQQPPDGKLCK